MSHIAEPCPAVRRVAGSDPPREPALRSMARAGDGSAGDGAGDHDPVADSRASVHGGERRGPGGTGRGERPTDVAQPADGTGPAGEARPADGAQPADRDAPAAGERHPAIGRRRIALSVLLAMAAIGGMYLLVPAVAGLGHTWGRLRHGAPSWLALAAVLELLSIGGYAALFGSVIGRGDTRIGWRASLQIPLAGIAALRLLATGGAGGFAVTVWALSRSGMPSRTIGSRIVTKLVIQYAVYMAALVACGIGLWLGLFPGGGPFALTVLPAIAGLTVIVVVLSLAALPGDPATATLPGRLTRWLPSAAATLRSGVRSALRLVARPPSPGLLAALADWGFDVAVLWCSFRAFSADPEIAVVVMGYFLGTLAGLLPLPGGIGGIEGGMIGAFIAFGVAPGQAVVAVLAYRAISFWLPTLPGIAGYLRLRVTVRGWERAEAERGGAIARLAGS